MGRGEGRVQNDYWPDSMDIARTALHVGFATTCCKVGACARGACHGHLPHVLRAALCADLYHQHVLLCYSRVLQHMKHLLRRGSVRGCGRCGSVLLRGHDAAIMHAVLNCCYMSVMALLVVNGSRSLIASPRMDDTSLSHRPVCAPLSELQCREAKGRSYRLPPWRLNADRAGANNPSRGARFIAQGSSARFRSASYWPRSLVVHCCRRGKLLDP
jgi:hypothetical protein